MPRFPAYRPAVSGRHYMVSSGHWLASLAAARVLQQGGNAIDAGVAAGLCTNVVQSDMTSFGGVAAIIIYLAREQRVVTISGVGTWPQAVSIDLFQERYGGDMPLGVARCCVPAAPDAWLTALEHFGTRSFAEVAADAITLAEQGFPMHAFMANTLREHQKEIAQWPSTAAIYLPQGRVPQVGEPFYQKDLARTLQRMVAAEAQQEGGREKKIRAARDFFYTGEIGKTMVEFCQQEGGFLTMEDMAAFQVEIEEPVTTTYRGYQVFACGPWCTGPVLLQMLNLLELFDLPGLEHNSAAYMHLVTEAMKLAFADRERYYGDPRFVAVPMDQLLSKAYAQERAALIDMERAWPEMPPYGNPASLAGSTGSTDLDTSALCVVDAEGNAFAATTSDTVYWTPVVPGLGIPISGRGGQSWLDPDHPSSVQPGKRPRLTPNPAIILRDGRLFAPLASPGGDMQPQAMLQVFLNMVHFGLDPQEAISAPRFGTWSFPNSFYPHAYQPGDLKVENRVDPQTLSALRAKGHRLEVWPEWEWRAGGVVTILVDQERGVLWGGADPRRENYAIGW
ncbi:MAG: gamma-glutamyltransferase family protein [Nitrospinota bacterium]|nr:MAG: gamma-glutamyltransferase family protein [Nitrospinota bacterium]